MIRSIGKEGPGRKSHMSAFIMLFLLVLVSCQPPGLLPTPIDQEGGANLTLAWEANTEPDLAGYRLYYGTGSGSYENSVDVGKQNSFTLSGLNPDRTYYFAATAYNTAGAESGYSNEVVYSSM